MFSNILRIFKKKNDGKTDEEWFNEGVALYNQRKYEKAIVCFDKSLTIKEDPKIRKIRDEAEIKLKESIVRKIIGDAKRVISQIKSKYNIKDAENILSQAEEAFKKGEYSKAEKLSLKAKEKAIEIGNQAEKAEKAIGDAKSTISQIKLEYDVGEIESLLSQAEGAFKKGGYSKTEELALKAKDKAVEIGNQAEKAEKAIGDAKKVISKIKSEYNVKEAEDTLSQAEEAFNKGDYSKSEKLALKAKEKAISAIDYITLWEYVTSIVYSVSITPDGEYIVAGGLRSNVYLFNRGGELLWEYGTDGNVESVAITPDGEYIVAGSHDNHVYLFNREGKLLWKYETGDDVESVAITPDGEYIVAGSEDDNVYLFNREGKLLWKYRIDDGVLSISITPDGEYIVAGGLRSNVYLFNRGGELLWKYGTGDNVYSVSITPDGEYIVAGSWDNHVYLFNREGKLLWKYGTGDNVYSVSITPDGEYIVAGSNDKHIYLFNKEGDLLWNYRTDGSVFLVSITPDGEYIVAGSGLSIYLFASLHAISKIIEKLKPKVKLIYGLDKLLESAKKEFKEKNYDNTLQYINKCNELINNAKPKLKIKLLNTSYTYNKWDKTKIEIINEGDAIAENITFEFSGDLTIKNLPEIKVKPKSKERVELLLKPSAFGDLPMDIDIKCKDHLNNEHKFNETIMLNVREITGITPTPETPEKGISPSEFTPKPTTPKTFPNELSEKYLEVEFIGKGGFARVFKAKRKDGKEVAVKIPISLDESTGKSFLKEIENWTKLNHNNIVKIYNYNILPIPYFEMELCDKSLADLRKPLDIEKATWIIFNIAEGLKYAHSKKILHRDLKPQNILLKDGIPKISDWGLSKVMTESSSATTTKAFTPYYASPEQIEGKSTDKRTDIWQLGVIFYELITGELPFKGESFVQIGMAIATKDPVKPSEINPEAKEVEKIIMKCLEKDKTKRYQSVGELQRDLSNYLGIKYKESLKLSVSRKDFKRSAYYCCDLLLLNMKINNMVEAYKYTSDLLNYTEGETKQEIKNLHEHLEYRIEHKIENIPEELIEMAEVIVHKIKIGF
ncbi:protein kinase [Methanothermococcus sp. SCGC AD-155-M21]|nr:protein kinase [Methanothermococcus sp. SCGC AD-155-M21]